MPRLLRLRRCQHYFHAFRYFLRGFRRHLLHDFLAFSTLLRREARFLRCARRQIAAWLSALSLSPRRILPGRLSCASHFIDFRLIQIFIFTWLSDTEPFSLTAAIAISIILRRFLSLRRCSRFSPYFRFHISRHCRFRQAFVADTPLPPSMPHYAAVIAAITPLRLISSPPPDDYWHYGQLADYWLSLIFARLSWFFTYADITIRLSSPFEAGCHYVIDDCS